MGVLNIDPNNDDMGNRVREAKSFLQSVRHSGNAIESAHFPDKRGK